LRVLSAAAALYTSAEASFSAAGEYLTDAEAIAFTNAISAYLVAVGAA
jgi:hypothetical protein